MGRAEPREHYLLMCHILHPACSAGSRRAYQPIHQKLCDGRHEQDPMVYVEHCKIQQGGVKIMLKCRDWERLGSCICMIIINLKFCLIMLLWWQQHLKNTPWSVLIYWCGKTKWGLLRFCHLPGPASEVRYQLGIADLVISSMFLDHKNGMDNTKRKGQQCEKIDWQKGGWLPLTNKEDACAPPRVFWKQFHSACLLMTLKVRLIWYWSD